MLVKCPMLFVIPAGSQKLKDTLEAGQLLVAAPILVLHPALRVQWGTLSRGQVKGVPFQLIQRKKMLVIGSNHTLKTPLLSYRSGLRSDYCTKYKNARINWNVYCNQYLYHIHIANICQFMFHNRSIGFA